MTRPWGGILPPPRGQGYYPPDEDFIYTLPDSPIKQSASTPRVTRSRFVEDDKMIVMRGNQFEDGKIRVVVPESASQTYVEEITATLEEHDIQQARMDRLMAMFAPKEEKK